MLRDGEVPFMLAGDEGRGEAGERRQFRTDVGWAHSVRVMDAWITSRG